MIQFFKGSELGSLVPFICGYVSVHIHVLVISTVQRRMFVSCFVFHCLDEVCGIPDVRG